MADVRLRLDEARWCIKGTQLLRHGIRRDAAGLIADHVDGVRPWRFQQALKSLANLDGIHYQSLDGETV